MIDPDPEREIAWFKVTMFWFDFNITDFNAGITLGYLRTNLYAWMLRQKMNH